MHAICVKNKILGSQVTEPNWTRLTTVLDYADWCFLSLMYYFSVVSIGLKQTLSFPIYTSANELWIDHSL